MPYDPIQGQDFKGQKVAKIADFKVCLSAGIYIIK